MQSNNNYSPVFWAIDTKCLSANQVAILYSEQRAIKYVPGYIQIWNTQTNSLSATIKVGIETQGLSVLKNKKQLINVSDDKVTVFDFNETSIKRNPAFPLTIENKPIKIIKHFSHPNENYMFISYEHENKNEIGIWDISGNTWKHISSIQKIGKSYEDSQFAVTPDHSKLIHFSSSLDNITVWDITNISQPNLHVEIDKKALEVVPNLSYNYVNVVALPDSKHVVVSSRYYVGDKGLVKIFDISSSSVKCVAELKFPNNEVTNLVLIGKALLGVVHSDSRQSESTVSFYSLIKIATPTKIGTIKGPELPHAIVFTPTPKEQLVCVYHCRTTRQTKVEFLDLENLNVEDKVEKDAKHFATSGLFSASAANSAVNTAASVTGGPVSEAKLSLK